MSDVFRGKMSGGFDDGKSFRRQIRPKLRGLTMPASNRPITQPPVGLPGFYKDFTWPVRGYDT